MKMIRVTAVLFLSMFLVLGCSFSEVDPHVDPDVEPDVEQDVDGDGLSEGDDCDDLDGELGGPLSWYADWDRDGFGDANDSTSACSQPVGHVADDTDNCPATYNTDQSDLDGDGLGDVCDPGELSDMEDQASECGGYEAKGRTLRAPAPVPPEPTDYCAAEVLHWTYDAAKGHLELLNTRIWLNCCGEHSTSLCFDDGLLSIYQLDQPEFIAGWGESRCSCLCVFDFEASTGGVPAGDLSVVLWRHETDQTDEPVLVWMGSLDLSSGSGSVVTSSEDVGDWCGDDY